MYDIRRTSTFEKSYKRLKKSGTLKQSVVGDLVYAIDIIAAGKVLPKNFRDHELTGEFKGYRECHIKGDLLLVYQRHKSELILVLVNIGSHSELFG